MSGLEYFAAWVYFVTQIQKRGQRPLYTRRVKKNQFTASFNALPALKPGTFAALIWMVAPVCGLRPVRAARALTWNVPNPTNDTVSPFLRAPVTADNVASNAFPASAFERPASDAIASINSDLFTLKYPYRFLLLLSALFVWPGRPFTSAYCLYQSLPFETTH